MCTMAAAMKSTFSVQPVSAIPVNNKCTSSQWTRYRQLIDDGKNSLIVIVDMIKLMIMIGLNYYQYLLYLYKFVLYAKDTVRKAKDHDIRNRLWKETGRDGGWVEILYWMLYIAWLDYRYSGSIYWKKLNYNARMKLALLPLMEFLYTLSFLEETLFKSRRKDNKEAACFTLLWQSFVKQGELWNSFE